MKVSVITSVFNREKTIADTIDSVCRQTHGDIEHIVQDAGSFDDTVAVLQRVMSPLVKLESKPDNGIYEGINRGILRATGDIIGLLHSDDLFASNNILSRVADVMSDRSVSGVYGDLVYVASDDLTRTVRYWRSGSYHPSRLKWGWMPPHPTLYLRREIFERLGVYDTNFEIAADYEGMIRFLTRGNLNLTYIPEVMVRMRVGGASNRSLGRIIKKSCEDYKIIRRYQIGGLGTLLSKNIRKISQFTNKDLGKT